MVEASSIDRIAMTSAATPKTRRIALRSAATILSMSPPSVDSISTPSTARKRWIGTATETISSPFSLTRTTVDGLPVSAFITSGKAAPVPPGCSR